MIKKTLQQILHRSGFRVSNLRLIPPAFLKEENLLKLTFELIVAQHLLRSSDFFFIQVGAFDGIECDPIRNFILQHHWSGILLEPQKAAFEQLQKNYAGQPQLTLKNAAIAENRQVRTLYTVGEGDVPNWCHSLASFDRDIILKHTDLVPQLPGLIKTEEVECLTFTDLIQEGQIKKVDLLQVDVEGYDAEVVSMFPFELIRPSIVHFERKHLSRNDLEKCLEVLVSYQYKFANDGAADLVAYCDDRSNLEPV